MRNSPNLLTESEAADYIALAPKTLQRRRWAGQPPSFIKLGTKVAYSVADLDAFIERGRVQR